MHNWSGNLDFEQRNGEVSTCYSKRRFTVRAGGTTTSSVLGHMDTQTIEELLSKSKKSTQDRRLSLEPIVKSVILEFKIRFSMDK